MARSLKGASEDFAPSSAGLEAPASAHATSAPSLRDRLAEFFRSGQNASDRELAALLGASVGSISVYRCQLKKLGIGVASPPGARLAAAGKRERRTGGGAKAGRPPKRAGASLGGGSPAGRGKTAKQRPTAAAAMPRVDSGALSLAEIDQVLIQNLETELGLIVERFPELARPVANIQQTVRLLLKLHRQ